MHDRFQVLLDDVQAEIDKKEDDTIIDDDDLDSFVFVPQRKSGIRFTNSLYNIAPI